MIRSSSSNKVASSITIMSYPGDPSSDSGGGPGGRLTGSRSGRSQQQQQAALQQQAGRAPASSLFVVLGVVVFLAVMGLFFLSRLQRAFELDDAADQLDAFQSGGGTWGGGDM